MNKRGTRKGNDLTIEMDIAYDYAPTIAMVTSLVKKDAQPFNVQVRLVKEIGPGGGYPLYAFTGAEDDLRSYLKSHHHAGLTGEDLNKEVEFYLGND